MITGLILGKFYPPHAGHHFLIDTALSECQQVIVLVMVNDVEKDSLPGPIRVNMIQSAHPDAFASGRLHVYDTVNNINVDYTSREADKAHAAHVWNTLSRVGKIFGPFKLYTSEEWGDRFAGDIQKISGEDVSHRMVDQKRIAKPISAYKIRNDFIGNWSMLAPTTRAAMTRRVVVCGGESTGTTTLARALAERYQTVWVPEYGRTFSESVGSHHIWTSDDFALLMEEQNRQEDLMATYAGPVMFL
jgi:HTH-type transcriptional repressor of NAD biosynthesis genes